MQQGDADKARKHGMEEYIAADPITFEHHALFKKLQSLSLDWRLNDPFASLVSFIIKEFFEYIAILVRFILKQNRSEVCLFERHKLNSQTLIPDCDTASTL